MRRILGRLLLWAIKRELRRLWPKRHESKRARHNVRVLIRTGQDMRVNLKMEAYRE